MSNRSTTFQRWFIGFVALLFCNSVTAQTKSILPDSLLQKINNQKEFAAKIDLIFKLGFEYEYTNIELADALFHKAIELTKAKKDYNKMGQAYAYWSYIYSDNSDFESCAKKLAEAKKITEKVNDKRIRIKMLMAESYYYELTKQLPKAIELHKKEIELSKAINDSSVLAAVLHNSGTAYQRSGDNLTADSLLQEAFKINSKLNNKAYLINNLNVLANIQGRLGHFIQAIEYNKLVLKMIEGDNNTYTECLTHLNMGDLYTMAKNYSEAKKCLDIGYDLAIKNGYKEWRLNALQYYASLFAEQKNFQKAYEFRGDYQKLKDSILNEKTAGKLADLEMELNQKKVELLHEAKAKTDAQLKQQQLLNEKQSFQFYAVFAGLILISVCMLFVFRNFLQKKKANLKIVEQNELLASKNKVIEQQKVLVEEKNKEIIDSISYAKGLQNAILPSVESIKNHFPLSFIFYKPKDIVAGDFYFFEIYNNHLFIAAADCTGHGVPGAMVSVVCSNALTRSVKEFNLTDPGKILDKTRELVVETFSKSSHNVKDGMDISLLAIEIKADVKSEIRNTKFERDENNFNSGSILTPVYNVLCLKWAGANNSLYYVESTELKEIKADKQSVSLLENPQPFTTHHLPNTVYQLFLFTDGYADQFGSDKKDNQQQKGKKFKSANFKKLLENNVSKPIDEQLSQVKNSFEHWKSDFEQTDDVCVIGIKFR